MEKFKIYFQCLEWYLDLTEMVTNLLAKVWTSFYTTTFGEKETLHRFLGIRIALLHDKKDRIKEFTAICLTLKFHTNISSTYVEEW